MYAIRGSQYRDVALWVDSLEKLLGYPAEVLLPGHTRPIYGREAVQDVLSSYKEAIESILLQTLACIDEGLSESETVERVKLPKIYQNKPYLGEFYGTIAWSVRAIYNGYLGWFDGNPTNLAPLPEKAYNRKLLELIGNTDTVALEIARALANDEPQMAMQLCDLLLAAGERMEEASLWKRQAMVQMADIVTSANGRHYYLTSAQDTEPAPELKLLSREKQ